MQTKVLPAYLYQQYTQDVYVDDLQAFFTAYNNISQTYLDNTNDLNLPVYTTQIAPLLDWTALSIYGILRPVLPYSGTISSGVYDEAVYDTTVYNENIIISPAGFYETTDDIFKRVITWNFYTGDGFQINTVWLKNRVYRFLAQQNGVPLPIPNTYDIGVSFASNNVVDIAINPSSSLVTFAPILQAAINSGALQLPFQYTFNVTY